MALVVLKPDKTMQGTLISTAYRGNITLLQGRSATGAWEFRVPYNSAEAAKACYVVTWEDETDYRVVIGSSTSDARDKNTTNNKKAIFHYGGWYRTNVAYIQGGRDGSAVVGKFKSHDDTAFYTEYGEDYWVLGWAISDATYRGYITDSSNGTGLVSTPLSTSDVTSGFNPLSIYPANMNANWHITSIDNSSAAPYGRDYWVEFKAIGSRIEAGYIPSRLATGSPLLGGPSY